MPFARAIDFDIAIQLIQQSAAQHTLTTQRVPLAAAVGRWTVQDLLAPLNVPAFACSRMDGYAIDFNHYQASGVQSMPLGPAIHAGEQLSDVYCGQQAIPVMTGGKLPLDATTVVIKEQARVQGDDVWFDGDIADGAHIRSPGSDVAVGQLLVATATRLKISHLGLLASVGIAQLPVKAKPRVALMMTGDELVQPGEVCAPGEIYDANATMLQTLLEQLGCEVTVYPPLSDSQTAVRQRLQQLVTAAYDLMLSVGGVSMGDKDWIPDVLQALGQVVFHKVKVKPGFPLLFGQLGGGLYFGLPGNPVSALTCLCQFVVPALEAMNAPLTEAVSPCSARLTHDINKTHDRHEFMRAHYRFDAEGMPLVAVAGGQQSSRIESLVEANCFVVLDAAPQLYRAGEMITIQPLSHFTGALL